MARRTLAVGVVAAIVAAVTAASAFAGASASPSSSPSPSAPARAALLARATTVGPPPLSPAAMLTHVGPLPVGWAAAVHTFRSGALARSYLTVAPTHLSGRVPLVLLLHGRNMTPDAMLHLSGLVARGSPAVLVVPAGWDESWNAGGCCGPAGRRSVDDVSFIRSTLARVLSSTAHVDRSRVYAVGFSNGGRLAYRLACRLPGMLAGFVAVEAVPVAPCPAMRPVDITVVAQQADPLLTVASGAPVKAVDGHLEPTVQATVARMAVLDRCPDGPSTRAQGLAVERTWSCADGTHLRYVWYPGGGHDWRPRRSVTPGATDFVRQMVDGRPPR